MSITVVQDRLGSTIQDMGRFGWQRFGINPSGAMDTTALQMANALLGNKLDEAVIESIFPAPTLYFSEPVFIALSGADFGASINNTIIPTNHPIFIPAHTTLCFTKKIKGNFLYLAVQGGFLLNEWLGSYSTNVKVGAGGLTGGYLRKGDMLYVRENRKIQMQEEVIVMPWGAATHDFYSTPIYFTASPESSTTNWWNNQHFTISHNSDRMGYRLQGGDFSAADSAEMISSAVTFGTIQLPPNKQPIVLMADHQTTGGYPRIGTVCGSSLPSLVQQNFTTAFLMEEIAIEIAEEKWLQQQRDLLILQQACTFRIQEHF